MRADAMRWLWKRMHKEKILSRFIDILLALLILLGISYRFVNMDWDSGALLHPDEYGLTNTLTRLSVPASLGNYFNTRESTLSPYDKYDLDGEKVADGPDNRMRWGQLPMLLIRLISEAINTTGYTELRRTGRYVNALMDVGTLLILFVIARLLFHDRRIALLGTALSSLAVMQIQQSHFMTVDNFSVFFCMLTLLSAVKIARLEIVRRDQTSVFRLTKKAWLWFGLFGLFLGMTIACKINHVVLGVMVVVAAFIAIAEIKVHSKKELNRVIWLGFWMCAFSAGVMVLTFRVFQPMSFRAEMGNTSFFTWQINKDWWDSMLVSISESSGIGGGPPSEQWAHRTPVVFPWINMVFYGMGIPLGLAVWVAGCLGLYRIFRSRTTEWKALLIPVFWSFFFFFFMGTRFVKCIRYMLPVYPTLCLLAGWGLVSLWRRCGGRRRIFPALAGLLVVGGTLLWSTTFVKTIYGQEHTRVEAVRWIYENIPALFQLRGQELSDNRNSGIPLPAPETVQLTMDAPHETTFVPRQDIEISALTMPHVLSTSSAVKSAQLKISILNQAGEILSETDAPLPEDLDDGEVTLSLRSAQLRAGERYTLKVELQSGSPLSLRRSVIANENWDEGLPFPLDGYDPFGQFYKGLTNEVRWSDSEAKKEMLLIVLEQADYLILPSQRSVWSAARIPLTYPMTLDYYEALFDGSLGFELAAEFQRPFAFGPLRVSDLAGSIAWNQDPVLPVKNLSIWSAEEAFSVYDHPPVWIFKKADDFDLSAAKSILDRADLTQVIVQGPTDAVWPEGYAGGLF